METNTTRYEFAHGKKPSGYGMWIFKITGTDASYSKYTTEQIQATGTFTDAKRAACREFKSLDSRIKHIVLIEVEA